MTTPARAYSWPPFAPGNTVALHHGAYSPRKVDPLAAELVEQAIAVTDYLAEPAYRPALWAWGRAEARVQLLEEWLAEHGQLDDDGKPRPATELLEKLERRAAAERVQLGLTPLARARLGRNVAAAHVDLARLWAEEGAEGPQEPPGPAAGPEHPSPAAEPATEPQEGPCQTT
jgi:hypothetical protein